MSLSFKGVSSDESIQGLNKDNKDVLSDCESSHKRQKKSIIQLFCQF